MANPASVYCIKMGGQLINKTSPEGAYSLCQLKDGTQVEEWKYYRLSRTNG